jgi:hypothetical protein
MVCVEQLCNQHHHCEAVKLINVIATMWECIGGLAATLKLQALGNKLMKEYSGIFVLILHCNELPTDVYCWIQLKDTTQTIKTHSYSCP